MKSLCARSSAADADTAPMFWKFVPSVENCHCPLAAPVSPDTAMPSRSPSASMNPAETRSPTRTPAGDEVPTGTDGKCILPGVRPACNNGASLTDVTVTVALLLAVLKAELPPLVDASPRLPKTPVVWSQARKLTLVWPWKFGAGRKRSLSVVRSSRAEVSLADPTGANVIPAFVLNCQVPLAAPLSA